MTIKSNSPGSIAFIAMLAACAATSRAHAGTIDVANQGTIAGLYNFIDNFGPVAWLGVPTGFLGIGIGANLVPNPPGGSISYAAEQLFAAQTTVTASQAGVTVALPYFNSPALPNLFYADTGYLSGLTGSWTITASNPSLGTFSFATNPIAANTPILPLATNIQASNLSTGATVSWVQPGFAIPNGDHVLESLFVLNNGTGQVIDTAYLPSNATSFNLSDLPTRLAAGGSYTIYVQPWLLDSNNADLSVSRSFYLFNPTSAVPEPATWAMLILGFLGLGVLARRRRARSMPQTA